MNKMKMHFELVEYLTKNGNLSWEKASAIIRDMIIDYSDYYDVDVSDISESALKKDLLKICDKLIRVLNNESRSHSLTLLMIEDYFDWDEKNWMDFNSFDENYVKMPNTQNQTFKSYSTLLQKDPFLKDVVHPIQIKNDLNNSNPFPEGPSDSKHTCKNGKCFKYNNKTSDENMIITANINSRRPDNE